MKTLSFLTILMLSLLLISPASEAAEQPTFKKLFWQVPAKKRPLVLKELQQLMLKMENHKRLGTVSQWEQLLWLSAHADGPVWCVNNGFIAQVEKCERSNRWSFDVRTVPEFQWITDAQIGTECSGGGSPCSLLSGLSADGSLFCAKDSTKTCLNQGAGEGLGRLSEALSQCREGKTEVSVGTRTLKCAPLIQFVDQQMATLENSCSSAVSAVRSVCNKTKTHVSGLITNRLPPEPFPAPPQPLPPSDALTDVLYIGDSHSVGCFGENLYSQMKNLGPSVGRSSQLSVRAMATCGSSSVSWTKSTHTPACGGGGTVRDCSSSGECSTTGSKAVSSLNTLLEKNKPRATVIALGTNNCLATNKSGKQYVPDFSATKDSVGKLIDQVSAKSSACIWVGPPEVNVLSDKFNACVGALKSYVTQKGCRYVDSQAFTDKGRANASRYHYDSPACSDWATGAFNGDATNPGVSSILQEVLKPAADDADGDLVI